jgi:hypothetical protein
MYAGVMRTTVDLPEDLHRLAMSIARDTSRSLSETVAMLMRRGLNQQSSEKISRNPVSGLPTLHLGTTITTEDVRALDDDE